MRGRLAGCSLIYASCLASSVAAQSISIDEERSQPTSPTSPTSPTHAVRAVPVPQPELIVAPRAITTPIAYPSQGAGSHVVVLRLTIGKDGHVTDTQATSGDALFASSAIEASKAWLFEPAQRGGRPIATKIQFAVRFVPPLPALETAANASPSGTRVTRAATPVVREILVVGQREPLKITLGHAEVHDMPGAFGDPYRAIESLPGVVPIVSGLPYFYVRGAPPGNVGYFFDGIPVPYLYHFAAGPGVLQPGFVDHVDLYPGAYPARYGRFAGAIVAGEMAPPTYRFRGEASIRLIDSGALIEAPFASGKGSAMVGARYSYTGAVTSLIVPKVKVDYWDYQGRARYDFDSKNSVELVSFGAGDFLSNQVTELVSNPTGPDGGYSSFWVTHDKTIVDVNFHRLDLRWDHRIPDGNWRNALMLGLDSTGSDDSKVRVFNHMVGARSEYKQALSKRVLVRGGGDVLFESLSQRVDNSSSEDDSTHGELNDRDFGFTPARHDLTLGAWADLVLVVTPKLEITPGIRSDVFVSGADVAVAVDPRISARYQLGQKLAVTHGIALVHQAPSYVVPIPGFKPSLKGGLQTALQNSTAVSYALPEGFESSLGVFQNAFFNMTDLISLVQLQNTAGGSDRDVRAMGHAYGLELMLRRSLSRKVGGFVSYTLSRSTRSDGDLHGPATTDRTHVLNVGLSGDLGRNWRLGGRFLFYSGIPTTVAYVRAAQAPPRTPPFWRIDFKLQKRWYIKRPDAWWGLSLEVLNTTLNKETLSGDCNAFNCSYDSLGPVTIPSLGAEGAF